MVVVRLVLMVTAAAAALAGPCDLTGEWLVNVRNGIGGGTRLHNRSGPERGGLRSTVAVRRRGAMDRERRHQPARGGQMGALDSAAAWNDSDPFATGTAKGGGRPRRGERQETKLLVGDPRYQ